MAFRQAYSLTTKNAVHWFPGHMSKGSKQIQQKLRQVDCIIEVHDARVPFSGRNADFQYNITNGGIKPHILVLNKMDLSESREQRKITRELEETQGIQHVIFTNCKAPRCAGLKRLLPLANELINDSDRFNRTGQKDNCVMIIGVPNVGKSSLINVLRNRHLHRKGASAVGAMAGVTRSVMERIKISEDPLTYMIDTPGILEPHIRDNEMGMKLALVGCVPDHLVGADLIADYLLYWLNRHRRYGYVPIMGLEKPTDTIAEVLIAGAKKLGVQRKMKDFSGQYRLIPDVLQAAQFFIRAFRKGDLGEANLDRSLS